MISLLHRLLGWKSYPLQDVFGVRRDAPQLTYVDRGGLDAQFRRALDVDRHIVIYGASKQGKSTLRRKLLPHESVIEVQCLPNMTADDIVTKIAQRAGYAVHASEVVSTHVSAAASPTGPAATASTGHSRTLVPPSSVEMIDWKRLGHLLQSNRLRVVIEDFHYLDEDQRKSFSFTLKALWEAGIFVTIVGVWAEQNLLVYYNGDLAQRLEEIDLVWDNDDLNKVLDRGESALNIRFTPEIRRSLIEDSFGNVGLLQTLAERLCIKGGILKTQRQRRIIGDMRLLEEARQQTASELRQRYNSFGEGFSRGLRRGRQSLDKYKVLLRVLVEASDRELTGGIGRDELLERMQKYNPRIRLSDLSSALNYLSKLQADTGISPLVFSYNPDTKKLSLVDRQLLFFRKHGSPQWPWETWTDDPDEA